MRFNDIAVWVVAYVGLGLAARWVIGWIERELSRGRR